MPDFTQINAELVLCALLLLAFLLSFFTWIGVYGKVAFFNYESKKSNINKPVSVIICARNEGDNLTEFLPKVLTQEYPLFEVIVVNDCSIDNTEDVLREFSKIFPNLRAINVKEDDYYKHGKKFAMMVGIKGAQYDHLLFTDGDCFPDSPHWISGMMEAYENDNTEIVLGYGPYIKKSGFLNKLIRFDAFSIALKYLSLAKKAKAYMGVGRNLSYKKDLFFKMKGFSTHYHIQSGDDDLFVNQAANETNTSVALNPQSFTYSIPCDNWTDWSDQKVRHLSTSPHYKGSSKAVLFFHHSMDYIFYALLITGLIIESTRLIALGIFFIRYITQMIIFRMAMKRLNETDLTFLIPLCEWILLAMYPIWHVRKRLVKPNKWKS